MTFPGTRLLAMMNRYVACVGSYPYRTPATLTMIAYLLLLKEMCSVQGGSCKPIEAPERQARKKEWTARCPFRWHISILLERQWDLQGLSVNTEAKRIFHTGDLAELSGSMYGALYRRAYHGLKPAFFRPSIADRRIQGLYYAGGTTHPGGGTPMAALSGMLAAEADPAAIRSVTFTRDPTNRHNHSGCHPERRL